MSLFNYWGTATNVTVTADAISDGGVPNPYVEWITDTVSVPDIGTFATASNGFIYDDIKLTGVSSPLRFRIKEGAPNDIQIGINLRFTARNGMDENDKTIYYNNYPNEEIPYTYTFIVQNGETLSGVIHEDMTLTADKYWIIENNVLIPEGVTVTVEPGTQIQFWSADPSNPYGADADVFIWVEGRFICEGTEKKTISMFTGKGYEDKCVIITGDSFIRDNDYEHSYISMKYVIISTNNTSSIKSTMIDHCDFNNIGVNALTISNTILNSYGVDAVGILQSCMCDGGTNDCAPHLKNNAYLSCNYINNNSDFVNNAILSKYINSVFVRAFQGHEKRDISGNY